MGIFDSGIGGLHVLAACRRLLPGCLFLYYGDNARAPYGSRTAEEISRFTREGLALLEGWGADAAVLACNTATAVCAEEMRRAFSFPVLGVEPAVRPAARICRDVLVLATPRTAESRRLAALTARFPQCRFRIAPLPSFAAAIERCLTRGEGLTLSDHLPALRPDGVVLGCTHYAFFRRDIAAFYRCPVFDGAQGTARRLVTVLAERVSQGKIGTDDHFCTLINPNNCLTFGYKKRGDAGVIFLGDGKFYNKLVYSTNICFSLE